MYALHISKTHIDAQTPIDMSVFYYSTTVTIGQYRYSLGWPTIGRGGLRALWHVYRGLSWPTIALFGRLPKHIHVYMYIYSMTYIRRGDRFAPVCLGALNRAVPI